MKEIKRSMSKIFRQYGCNAIEYKLRVEFGGVSH